MSTNANTMNMESTVAAYNRIIDELSREKNEKLELITTLDGMEKEEMESKVGGIDITLLVVRKLLRREEESVTRRMSQMSLRP